MSAPIRSAEQRGDLRAAHRLRLRHGGGRSRRLDRLLGRLPDRRRQGRGLVRGRRLGRNPVAHRAATCGTRARGSTSSARCRVGDELGGHIVTGHVDGVGRGRRRPRRRAIRPGSASARRRRSRRYLAAKGLDHARRRLADRQRRARRRTAAAPISRSTSSRTPPQQTTFGDVAAGRQLNVEIDVLARYLERMLDARSTVERADSCLPITL